jgi:two-component system, OmpR family, sensor kinase
MTAPMTAPMEPGVPTSPHPPRRRGTLATRIAVLSIAIAVGTAIIAGALAIGLIRTSGNASARRELARLATASQTKLDNRPRAGPTVVSRLLQAVKVQSADVTASGQVTGAALAKAAVTPTDVRQLLTGRSVSATRTVKGKAIYVEGRPTGGGGIVLVQRRADADAFSNAAIRRTIVALLVAAAVAAALGLLVAWRLARPLRRTAQAAHALAAGQRQVVVEPGGPAEVAEVADAVNRLSGALSLSEGRQREFLMSVSHDLRTPLTAITGYAESLADGVVESTEIPAVGAVMLGEARRLERLVADLLDLARLDGQDFRLDVGPIDLNDVVHGAAQVWSDRCRAAGVSFHLEAPPYPLPAYSDAARIRQVLDGLLENALRVTPSGAPIVLAARSETAAGGIRVNLVEVRDGGPGLSDADLLVAFQRGELHRRYRGVRQVGTGLGLAIVHGLVSRLGGTVEAGRGPEGGARFTVRLRAAAAPPEVGPAPTS